jgi:hypothetical protein
MSEQEPRYIFDQAWEQERARRTWRGRPPQLVPALRPAGVLVLEDLVIGGATTQGLESAVNPPVGVAD